MENRMNIRALLRVIFNVWTGLITLGVVMLVGGGVQTIRFVNRVHMYKELTARQLAQELIIPHMIMLCGMGLLVASIIFMVRGAVVRARMNHDDV
jgi:hypothetical protein